MKVRSIDTNGDWQFGKGLQSYRRDVDALKQIIATRLKQWRGNCFFAVNEGVDWNNYLGRGTKKLLDLDIKRVILTTGGVLKINSFDSTLDEMTRKVTVQCNISTIYGELVLEEDI
jgi:hypothetical protein